MPSIPFLYSDFRGGLNTKDQAYLLTDNQSRDVQNVQGTTAGAIVKRNGMLTFGTSAPATMTSIRGVESLSPNVLITTGGTGIYKIDTSGVVTSIGGASFSSGLRWAIEEAPIVSGRGPVYMMNGTDTPQYWSGSGSTANWTNASGGVAVPNGSIMTYHNNQMFVAGTTATPSGLTGVVDPQSTVYWSAIADPTNWDPTSLKGAGFASFDPNDGDFIRAVANVGPYLMVAKRRKMWILVDPTAPTIRLLSDNIGCVASRSVASGPDGTFFLSEDRGVYLTNGSKITPISDVIFPTIHNAVGDKSLAAGVVYEGHYYLSFPRLGLTNDTIIDYDTTLGSWWLHTVGTNEMTIWHNNGVDDIYSAGQTSGQVEIAFKQNVLQDNGNNFTWIWRGPWQSPTFYRRRRFPTPYFRKNLRQVRADGFGQVDFSLAKDFAPTETLIRSDIFDYQNLAASGSWGDSGDVWGGGKLWGGGANSTLAKPFFSLGVARGFSLVFSGTNNAPATITSYVMMITDRKDLVVS